MSVAGISEPRGFMASGNRKVGRRGVLVFSLQAGPTEEGGTCTATTEWCRVACYSRSGRFRMRAQTERRAGNYQRIVAPGGFELFEREVPREIRTRRAKDVRVHDSGDMFSIRYIRAWVRIVDATPDVNYWLYTRAWKVPEFQQELEVLRARPNVQMFASVDPTQEERPPAGWRLAGQTGMGLPGVTCPQQIAAQNGREMTCRTCRYCLEPRAQVAPHFGNVLFIGHGQGAVHAVRAFGEQLNVAPAWVPEWVQEARAANG